MQSPVETIKERLSIVDIVSEYLKLEKAGSTYKARCPFHNEKSASFFVSPSRNTFHCFGCQKGGDIFTFVQEMEAVNFPEAIKILAEKAGIKLENNYFKKEEDKHERHYKVLEEATRYFESNFKANDLAKKYLLDRGLKEETIDTFRIGFAKDSWTSLVNHLRQKGYTDDLIIETGLGLKSQKGLFDRFRSRIMFPISDSAGKIIAFSGRIFGKDSTTEAKYINSPETELFHKSKVLFGFDLAKRAMLKSSRVIVVEGQFDYIMSHQAGFPETVAVSGTALTTDHLQLIRRFADKIIFAFDNDMAGWNAIEKSANLANSFDFDVFVVNITGGKDPADIILSDQKLWSEMVNEAQPFVDAYILKLKNENLKIGEIRKLSHEKIFPYIRSIHSQLMQANEIEKIASYLGVGVDIIKSELSKIETRDEVAKPETSSFSNKQIQITNKLAGLLFYLENQNISPPDGLIARLNDITKNDYNKYFNEKYPDKTETITFAEIEYGDIKNHHEILENLIDEFELYNLKDLFKEKIAEIKSLEKTTNKDLLREKILECNVISKKVEELKTRIRN